MRAATAPMHVVIGRADQEPPPSISSHAVFVRCAITDGAAMPSHMASDPLDDIIGILTQINENLTKGYCKFGNYSSGFLTIILVMSYLKNGRLMRLAKRREGSSCLCSPGCLKTRLIINVSKHKTFHGKVRHQSPE